MRSDEIRSRFLKYFERQQHSVRPSASLVPADDPTLLFVNAGMVPFKRVFLGSEEVPFARATTAQKCVRAGGKHNDLEEVGFTPRHHTFFEMLGNFSFGDYFKEDAIRFAWEFLTDDLGMDPERLWVTVHHTDDDAARLWQLVAGVPAERILRLGDEDNFWQMADTGPCGPCSEIHYDLRADGERGPIGSVEEFISLTDRSEILEFWNLVFMQFDRDAEGELTPLPAPSIDTGLGLERLAMLLQKVGSNYGTDLFAPLIERAVEVVGTPYEYESPDGASYRVLADHARTVAFLLADGVFPSNEGRGYVLRRILRRGVRHAWLLGRREPTLVEVVDATVALMGDAYPRLRERRELLLRATRAEEERFLNTIDEGMRRFDEIAPEGSSGTVDGAEMFKLYDTFGFPADLTELMARERGYAVDIDGFNLELEAQRRRSRQDRAESAGSLDTDDLAAGWEELDAAGQEFIGYETTEVQTEVLGFRRLDGRLALQLRENPFYAESGGQVSDRGHIFGDGWTLAVDDVRRVAGQVAVLGSVEGDFSPGPVRAVVEDPPRRDTERNHTATHLLHAALRRVLGDHVHQQGSLVSPEKLRFDFSHTGALDEAEIDEIEGLVNEAIWANTAVCTAEMAYQDALQRGAMALFSEKYGDVVRTIDIPGVSLELCGGTHVRSTGQIGGFRITSETGVAAGVRRIEAVTGREAYRRSKADAATLHDASGLLRTREENLLARVTTLLDENKELVRQLERARSAGGADQVAALLEGAATVAGLQVVAAAVDAEGGDELRALGDALRERLGNGVAVLAGTGERVSLLAVATDEAVQRGARADQLVREVAALAGGRGGGKAHMAQAGGADPDRIAAALEQVAEIVQSLVQKG